MFVDWIYGIAIHIFAIYARWLSLVLFKLKFHAVILTRERVLNHPAEPEIVMKTNKPSILNKHILSFSNRGASFPHSAPCSCWDVPERLRLIWMWCYVTCCMFKKIKSTFFFFPPWLNWTEAPSVWNRPAGEEHLKTNFTFYAGRPVQKH